jgi:hypothetical protein
MPDNLTTPKPLFPSLYIAARLSYQTFMKAIYAFISRFSFNP